MRYFVVAGLAALIALAVVSYVIIDRLDPGTRLSLATPSGLRIYKEARQWQGQQASDSRYLQKGTCAYNVMRVLHDSGFYGYATPWAPEIVKRIKLKGGSTFSLGRTPRDLVASLNLIYGGKLPTGAVVAGCYAQDCTGDHGARHIGIVGEDEGGIVYLYHNNYYIPRKGQTWQTGMVSPEFIAKGINRQWMRTPWLALSRNSNGLITDAAVLLPRMIGVVNPLLSYVNIAVPAELGAEIARGEAFSTTFGRIERFVPQNNVLPLPWLTELVYDLGPRLHNATNALAPTHSESLAARR